MCKLCIFIVCPVLRALEQAFGLLECQLELPGSVVVPLWP